jgi:hypothetical protein
MRIPILVYEQIPNADVDPYKLYFGHYYTEGEGKDTKVYSLHRVNEPVTRKVPILSWNKAVKGTDEYARATIARAVKRNTGFLYENGDLYYPQWVNN